MMMVHYVPDKIEGNVFIEPFGLHIFNGSVTFLKGKLRISGCEVVLSNYACFNDRKFAAALITVFYGGKLVIEAQDVEVAVTSLLIFKGVDIDIRLHNAILTVHQVSKHERASMKIVNEDTTFEMPREKLYLEDVCIRDRTFNIGILVTNFDPFGISVIKVNGGVLKIRRIVQATNIRIEKNKGAGIEIRCIDNLSWIETAKAIWKTDPTLYRRLVVEGRLPPYEQLEMYEKLASMLNIEIIET